MQPSTRQWQIPFAVQLIPAGLLVICMSFMIESPRWLVRNGKYDKALKNLSWVRNLPEDHEYVQLEYAEMRAQVEHEVTFGANANAVAAIWKELSAKGMRGRLILSVTMKIMQNMSGFVSRSPRALGRRLMESYSQCQRSQLLQPFDFL